MKTNLKEKFDKIKDHWHPYIIGDLNDNYVKLAKLQGDFVWHQHDLEDELFVVISGTLMMDFKDGTTSRDSRRGSHLGAKRCTAQAMDERGRGSLCHASRA